MLCSLRSLARLVTLLLVSAAIAFGQQPATGRIISPVSDVNRITLSGNTHPLARAKYDNGRAPDSMPAERMLLLLGRSPEQQAALAQFMEEQQTSGAANYRQWLTPAQFGQLYGPADSDVQTVTAWLQQHGFQVNRVASARNVIEFSGTAGQVREALHTELHKYVVGGQEHWANASDPQIPAALAPVVKGVASLNNFPRKPQSHSIGVFERDWQSGRVKPQFTLTGESATYYALGPADFATIYNSAPLLQGGDNGSGQTIAIVGLTNINLQDVTDFRTLFGLGAGKTSVVLDGPDPGIVAAEEMESLLDVEWANAVAPGATVVLVSAEGTATTNGLDLAAWHIIENNMAGVMSESYSECEAGLGTAGNQFEQAMWEQAAAQGITVIVSAGDNGSAGCDNQDSEYVALYGLAVNGLASTPFNVAVGGTDFNDANDLSTYWNSSNASTTQASAKSYIPEMPWNQTCAASASSGDLSVCPEMPASGTPPSSLNLWAGSGGASNCSSSTTSGNSTLCTGGTAKPSWQSGKGVPADDVRDVPDISFYAAANSSSHSFYVVCEADQVPAGESSCQFTSSGIYFMAVGGTSASAPSFAGIIALAEGKAGTRLGNVNYALYSLAAKDSCTSSNSESSSCVFNDVVTGNNSVPCVAGSPNCSVSSGSATGVMVNASGAPAYLAAAGYDLATGLGSVNANNLAKGIASISYTPTKTALTLNGGSTTITAKHGQAVSVAVEVSPTAASGDVSLLGPSNGIDGATLNNGSAIWSSTLFPGGSYSVTAHYAGDGTRGASNSNAVPVTISPENSQTFVDLLTWDINKNFHSYTSSSAPYGSSYVLRFDVGNAAASVSSSGVSSTCTNGTASCPTGTLTVTSNNTSLGSFPLNSAGHAEDQTIQLVPGTYNIVANYPGDASYNPSAGTDAITITKAPTTISVGPAPLPPYNYGEPTQIDASVTTTSTGVAPTGTFTLFDNGTPANVSWVYEGFPFSNNGTRPMYANLNATTSYSFTSIGSHTLTAQYSGDANYTSGSSEPTVIGVGQATPMVSGYGIVPTSTTTSLPVTLTLILSGWTNAPTGSVSFSDSGTLLNGTVTYSNPNPGQLRAVMSYTFTAAGTHTISATYSGDTNYTSTAQSLGALTVYTRFPVTAAIPASSLNPALVNYSTNLSVQLSTPAYSDPAPTGTVSFYDNGSPLSGTVTYTSSFNSLTATLPYSFGTTGTRSITAAYSGDPNCAAVTSPVLALSIVSQLPTSIPYINPTTAIANQPVNLSLDVYSNVTDVGPTMTGTVVFSDNSTTLTAPVNYSQMAGYLIVTTTQTFSSPGNHNITAQYSGDANYAASKGSTSVTVQGPLGLTLPAPSVTMNSVGGTNTINVSVNNNTSTADTVTLSCTPDRSVASCSLSSSVNVGANSTQNVTLTYTVPALSGQLHPRGSPWSAGGGLMVAGVFAGAWFGVRRRHHLLLAILAAALLMTLVSCGGGGSSSSGGGSTSAIYHFTINATSGSNTASQVLTVTVD